MNEVCFNLVHQWHVFNLMNCSFLQIDINLSANIKHDAETVLDLYGVCNDLFDTEQELASDQGISTASAAFTSSRSTDHYSTIVSQDNGSSSPKRIKPLQDTSKECNQTSTHSINASLKDLQSSHDRNKISFMDTSFTQQSHHSNSCVDLHTDMTQHYEGCKLSLNDEFDRSTIKPTEISSVDDNVLSGNQHNSSHLHTDITQPCEDHNFPLDTATPYVKSPLQNYNCTENVTLGNYVKNNFGPHNYVSDDEQQDIDLSLMLDSDSNAPWSTN